MSIFRSKVWQFVTLFVVVAIALGGIATRASANHGSTSISDSKFELDTSANLKVDDEGNIDWLAGGTNSAFRSGVIVQADKPTGGSDDSFGNGAKEDTAVPSIVDGGIPPNKSDLKFFGVYKQKTGTGSFLHLFWSRVQDPQGTTNMDFEFNQSQQLSGNKVTPVRTPGDLLITYDLSNGGTVATISKRVWNGTAWGSAQALTGSQALGTINTAQILSGDAGGSIAVGGIGAHTARTFGEASLNLNTIFSAGSCQSFGSAYLKSRSSDSFTAALKDFIAPVPVNLTNCGSVLVRKTDASNGQTIAGATFVVSPGQTVNGVTSPSTTMTEVQPGIFCTDNLLFGQVTVTETAPPAGYELANPASQQFVVNDNGTCASRTSGTITPDLTFANPPVKGTININKKNDVGAALGGAVFTLFKDNAPVGGSRGNEDTITSMTCTTVAGTGNCSITDVPFGKYWVVETTIPAGHAGAVDQYANISSAGQVISLNFVNPRLFKQIVITCDMNNNLVVSTVTQNGVAKDTIMAPPANVTAQQLCGLGGASFDNLSAGTYNPSVNLPK